MGVVDELPLCRQTRQDIALGVTIHKAVINQVVDQVDAEAVSAAGIQGRRFAMTMVSFTFPLRAEAAVVSVPVLPPEEAPSAVVSAVWAFPPPQPVRSIAAQRAAAICLFIIPILLY